MSTITVRDAKIEDAQRILEIYAYYVENTAITFEYDVPSKEEFKERMRKTMQKIGRASCRERVCQYVLISVVAVSLKKNEDG